MPAYGTPEGLITMRPRSRSMPLTLPHVWITSPCFTSSRFARRRSSSSCSSMVKSNRRIRTRSNRHIQPDPIPDFDHGCNAVHHTVQISVPAGCRTRHAIPGKAIQLAINRVRLGLGLNTCGFNPVIAFCGRGEIPVRARRHRAGDRRAQRAGLGRARNFHRPAGHIRVNLHDQRIFFRDAAAIDHLLDLSRRIPRNG